MNTPLQPYYINRSVRVSTLNVLRSVIARLATGPKQNSSRAVYLVSKLNRYFFTLQTKISPVDYPVEPDLWNVTVDVTDNRNIQASRFEHDMVVRIREFAYRTYSQGDFTYLTQFTMLTSVLTWISFIADQHDIPMVGSTSYKDFSFTQDLWRSHPNYFNNDSHLKEVFQEFSWEKMIGKTRADKQWRRELRHEGVSLESLSTLTFNAAVGVLTTIANEIEMQEHL